VKNKNIKFFIIIKEKSERIKNKNFVLLNKLPLFKHLLYELKNEDVFVDTDSNRIIKECLNDKKLSKVHSYIREKKFVNLENSKSYNKSPVLLMIYNFLNKFCNDEDIIVCSHVTSPFIKLKTIKKAINYLNKGYDSVSSATFHNEFGLVSQKNNYKRINFTNNVVKKTQDLDPIVLLNGAFFIFKKKTFIKYKSRYSKKHYYYKLDYPESIDINYHSELKMAKFYAKNK